MAKKPRTKTPPPELISGRELGRRLGLAPSYISKLRSRGVLSRCLVPRGKRMLINPALAVEEIEAARDPAMEHVRQRWDDYRRRANTEHHATPEKGTDAAGGGQTPPAAEPTAVEPPPAPEPAGAEGGDQGKVVSFQDAKTRKEIMLANKAELDFREKAGELVDKEATRRAALNDGVMVREALGGIPDRLAQVLAAETNPDRIHELLTQEINQVLHVLADRIEQRLGVRLTA